jgi:hypothetical protein
MRGGTAVAGFLEHPEKRIDRRGGIMVPRTTGRDACPQKRAGVSGYLRVKATCVALYVRGRVPMVGASKAHNRIAPNIGYTLDRHLRGAYAMSSPSASRSAS